jgi:hypothetical protein
MINAITPARQKYANAVAIYRYPIVLWSVDVTTPTIRERTVDAGSRVA